MTGRVGLAGDWHGNVSWAMSRIRLFAAQGISTIYHVGDFGLWPGATGEYFLKTLHRACVDRDLEMFIVLGNHEDYHRAAAMQLDEQGWLCLENYPRFRFAPRGHAWIDAHGARFAALGGAGSIDRNTRRIGVDWWPQEELTQFDCDRLIANVRSQQWPRVDVMLTHDAPAGLRRIGMTARPAWFTPEIEDYCTIQRTRLRRAMDEVLPRWLAHGHWHDYFRDSWDGLSASGTDYHCEVLGLAADGMRGNAVIAEVCPGFGLGEITELLP